MVKHLYYDNYGFYRLGFAGYLSMEIGNRKRLGLYVVIVAS